MEINGLTARQVEMLDIMWSIDQLEDLDMWKSTLPKEERPIVDTLFQMIVYASIDEEFTDHEHVQQSQDVLAKYRLKDV